MGTLGDLAVGSIVKLKVDGVATNFIVVQQGRPSTKYAASCIGTWLLMEDCYKTNRFDGTSSDYANSDVYDVLNGEFVNLLDSDIVSVIKQAVIPYTKGAGNTGTVVTGSSGLSTKIFLLSYTEVGLSGSQYVNVEGAALSYFKGAEDSLRVAYLNGSVRYWWLRSPLTFTTNQAWEVTKSGSGEYGGVNATTVAIRPAMILDSTVEVNGNGEVGAGSSIGGFANIGGEYRELSAGYANIGGEWHEVSGSYKNIGGEYK